MTEFSPAKTEEYPRIFLDFQNCARCEKDMKNNKHNSLDLGRKYVPIFVLGHYLFHEAHSFPRATLLELRSRKTVRFSEQIMSADKYPSIFSRQMEAIVYIFSRQMEAIDWADSVSPRRTLSRHDHVINSSQ